MLKLGTISFNVTGSETTFLDCPFIWICAKSKLGLFWAETRHQSKFCGNLLSRFCLILLTNQQTNYNIRTQVKTLLGTNVFLTCADTPVQHVHVVLCDEVSDVRGAGRSCDGVQKLLLSRRQS